MPVSERELIASANIHGWRNTTPAQFAEELASLSAETNRIADPYSYSITTEGELFSSTAGCRVKDTIGDKASPLGQLEYQAVLATEQWAASNKNGVSVWISGPKRGVYPTTKIIVQEIEYDRGTKTVFNRAILLDFDEEQCMKFAWNLTSFSRNKPVFRNLDEIRAVPLILDIQNGSWIEILEKLIDTPAVWAMIRNGEDKQYKKEALKRAVMVQKQFFASPGLSYSDEVKMAVMQMLGPRSGSCPPRPGSRRGTGFQVVAGSAVTMSSGGFAESDSKGERTFPCPACGYINERPYEGYVESCQNPDSCPNRKAVCC